nr:hypothetical protein [Streptomyces sp. NWU49]
MLLIVWTAPCGDRLRFDPRIQEGKPRREIVRCLEQYAAREAFGLVRTVSTEPSL